MAAAFNKYWGLILFTVYVGLMVLGIYAMHWGNASDGWCIFICFSMGLLSFFGFVGLCISLDEKL